MRRGAHSSELAVIGRIYDASLRPQLWDEIVAAIVGLLGASKGILLSPQHRPPEGGMFVPFGLTESHFQQYAAKYHAHDLWFHAAVEKGLFAEGCVMTDADLVPHDRLLDSVYYREFLHLQGIARLASAVVFAPGTRNGLPTILSVYRSAGQAPFGASESGLLKILGRHVSRALGITYRLRNAELQIASTRAALDRIPSGVVLVGANREVVFANSSARAMLSDEDGIRMRADPGGRNRLLAATESDQKSLDRALDQCLDPGEGEVDHFSQAILVARPSGLPSYAINVSALPKANEFGAGMNAARAIAFVTDPAESLMLDADMLGRLYGLTAAESRLAESLCKGGSLLDLAQRLGLSENTVKTQMQSVFEKTRTSRQAELVKLLLSLGSTRVN